MDVAVNNRCDLLAAFVAWYYQENNTVWLDNLRCQLRWSDGKVRLNI